MSTGRSDELLRSLIEVMLEVQRLLETLVAQGDKKPKV